MEAENCIDNCSEMPGPDKIDITNEETRVSKNFYQESNNGKKVLDEDSDDSEGIPILPFTGIQKMEVFPCLPLPDFMVDFDIDNTWKNTEETEMEPPAYEHIRRSIL
ncbi:hypothetical protein AgCh_006533 [Apium graveolens]